MVSTCAGFYFVTSFIQHAASLSNQCAICILVTTGWLYFGIHSGVVLNIPSMKMIFDDFISVLHIALKYMDLLILHLCSVKRNKK